MNCGKHKTEIDQGVGDAARTRGEADQDRGKAQEYPDCAIIIAHSVKKHTDIYCLVNGRDLSRKIPIRKTNCVVRPRD